MTRRRRFLIAVLAVAAAVGAAGQDSEGESSPVAADEPVADEQVVVADGHVDLGPRFLDGEWTVMVRDDTVEPSVWRHLLDVVWHATDTAALEVPDDPAFAFLGDPGARVWVLPQVQQPGVLWPGWNTQDPEVATAADRGVTLVLHDVRGPGAMSLFVNGDFGQPEILLDSRDPYPQSLDVEPNTHAHGNWVFTAPGTYALEVEMTATTADGRSLSAIGLLQVAVGDATDPNDAFTAPDSAAPDGDDTASTPGDTDASAPEDSSEAGDDGGSSAEPVAVLAAVAGVAVLVGVAVLLRRRRRGGDPEAGE